MIYLDTSVVLAQLFSEDRRPPDQFWKGSFISSRILEYEVWTRWHGGKSGPISRDEVNRLIHSVTLVELSGEILEGITEGFPKPVRTLDAIHLATMRWMQEERISFQLATYDQRMSDIAVSLGISLADGIS